MNSKIDEQFLNRLWYETFCDDSEIDGILNPKNKWDFLMKKRADFVADNARYLRVFVANKRRGKFKFFKDAFSLSHYDEYLSKLSKEDREKCSNIAYGDIFYKELNAYTESTDYGIIIYLNESLHYFMYFLNFALTDFELEIPMHIRLNAVRIALRVYLQKEALDFELDPRGIVPKHLDDQLNSLVFIEKQFIVGHEFSHFLLGHLGAARKQKIHIIDGKFSTEKVYNHDQKKEFEADLMSIIKPSYSNEEKKNIIQGALLFFASLDLTEYVDKLFNPGKYGYKTHPDAIDRFVRIKETFLNEFPWINQYSDSLLESIDFLKKFIKNDLDENLDQYEIYGSAYLDKPNTKWRGKELKDRVDY